MHQCCRPAAVAAHQESQRTGSAFHLQCLCEVISAVHLHTCAQNLPMAAVSVDLILPLFNCQRQSMTYQLAGVYKFMS